MTEYQSSIFVFQTGAIIRVPNQEGYAVNLRCSANRSQDISDLRQLTVHTPKERPFECIGLFCPGQRADQICALGPAAMHQHLRIQGYCGHFPHTAKGNQKLEDIQLPPGYELEQHGEIQYMHKSFSRLRKAVFIALILVYFSLVPIFRSFLQPLTIMGAIPLALIGVFWGMLLAGKHFCIPASMSIILLSHHDLFRVFLHIFQYVYGHISIPDQLGLTEVLELAGLFMLLHYLADQLFIFPAHIAVYIRQALPLSLAK